MRPRRARAPDGDRVLASAALTRLREEHERIAELVDELRESLTSTTDPAEVERLTSTLEAHLTYEEEELIPLLDAAP